MWTKLAYQKTITHEDGTDDGCGGQSFIPDSDFLCDKLGDTTRIITMRDPHLFSPDSVADNVNSRQRDHHSTVDDAKSPAPGGASTALP